MAFKFDEWFERFWLYYPRDLCHKKPGGRPEARTAAKRKVKSQKEADRVNANTEAWLRYSNYEKSISKNNYTDRWPAVSVWFNQTRYDWEIPSYTQEKEKENKNGARVCKHCSEPVHGPNYETCTNHLHIADKPAVEPRADHRTGMSAMKEALNKEN